MVVAFRQQMLFVFFIASFSFAYLMLRPILVYFDFYFRYRALYPEFLLIPTSYWSIAALIAVINIGFLFWLYVRFGKKEQTIRMNWNRIPEKNPDRIGFFATSLAFLVVHEEAAYYFCLAYLLAYKARLSTKLFAAVVVIIFAITTDDRRHFVGILIFILAALIEANKDSFAKASISSFLKRTAFLAVGGMGLVVIAMLSIYYRSPENLQSILNWQNAAVVVEVQLDFAHVYDELHNLTSELLLGNRDFIIFGLMFIRIFLFFIPRGLWPEKPETVTREYAEAFNLIFYDYGGSLPVGLIGDSIFSFGIFFVIGLILVVELFRLYIRLKGNSYFALAMLTVLTFFIIRGPFDAVMFVLAAGILFYTLRVLVTPSRRRA